MVTIHLNGEARDIDEGQDLATVVDRLDLPAKRIAVELNGTVIRRADWPDTLLNEADRIEVVHFVGGG
jgi:sulfur carrier protein